MKSNTLQITSFYQKVLDLKERGRVCMCEFDFTEISFLHCRVLSEFEFIELKKGEIERESVCEFDFTELSFLHCRVFGMR